MEHPAQRPGAHVVGMDVPGIRVITGALCRKADDEEIAEDTTGVAGLQRVQPVDRSPARREARANVDTSLVAKGLDGLAGPRVGGSEESAGDVEQPAVVPICAAPVV